MGGNFYVAVDGVPEVVAEPVEDLEIVELLDRLQTRRPNFVADYHWSVTFLDPERLVLVGLGGGQRQGVIAATRSGTDPWKTDFAHATNCRVKAVGWGHPAEWMPDVLPGAEDSVLALRISEVACASGELPIGREIRPIVRMSESVVAVTVLVEPRAGFQTCPSNDWFPIEVDIGEPLGDRLLVEGSNYPPRIFGARGTGS